MNKIVTILTTGLLFVATSVFSQLTYTVSPQPISGNIGDTVSVDITVTNFQNILSTQFSFAYDASILQFEPATNPDNFPSINPSNISNPSSGVITLAWFDNTTVGVTQPDGTRFFSLNFVIIANVGTNTTVMFSNSPTPLEVIDGTGTELTVGASEVFFDDGTPGGALNPANSCTDNDNDGVCVADDCDDNNPAIGQIGSACNDGNANTTNDQIQSDCSCSGTVIPACTDNDNDGVCIADDCDDNNPAIGQIGSACNDGNANTTNDQIQSDCSCSGTATGGGNTGGGTTSNCTPPSSGFALIGSAESGNVGDVVCVQITTQDFDNILSMQYSMSWDPTVLQYSSVQNINLTGLNGAINGPMPSGTLNPGFLGVGWADPMALGVSVADGTVLYEVCFTVLASGQQQIDFGGNPVPIEVVDSGGNAMSTVPNCPATVNFGSGGGNTGGGNTGGGNTGGGNTGGDITVSCAPPVSGFALIGSAEAGDVGDVVCVQITTQDFNNILSMQYSMSWDPAVLQYNSVQNINLAGLSGAINGPMPSGTLSPGFLGIGWADPMATGVSVADGTVLYEVCFTVLASGQQQIDFGGNPVPIEVVDSGGNAMSTVPNCPATVNFSGGGGNTGGGNTGGGNTGGGTTTSCTPPASGFALIGSAEAGDVGDVVCVQITTQDFDNILSMQYSMSWDPTVLQYSSVQNINLAGLSGAINGPMPSGTLSPGFLGIGWADPMATGVSVADGTVLYEVCFTVLASGPQQIDFGDSPVPIEIVDGGGNALTTVPNCPATVNFDTGGNPPTNPVTCIPPASGFAILGSAVTGNVGDVVCVQVSTQEFNNIIGMQYSMNWDPTILEYESVQGFNLSGIGISNFSNPNPGQLGLLWTDPNVSGITVADGTSLYEVCFTILSNGTAEIDFTGTPVPIEVTDGNSMPVSFQSCPAVVSQPTGGPGGPNGFAVIATDQMAAPGTNICIPVSVNDFTDIVSMQYSMTWDPAILTFTGTQNFGLNGLAANNFNSTTAGSLGLTWLDPAVAGLSVANGTVIYEACFDVNQNAPIGSTSSFSFGGSPVPIEVTDGDNNPISFSGNDATITVVPSQVDPIDIVVGNVSGNSGDIVCVPITVNNFDDILGFQFSMNWDPAVLMYSSLGNFGLPDLAAGQFGTQGTNNGQLTFAWIDNSSQGVSLLDGSTVFEICFEIIGAGGSSSSITIGNTPTPIEITSANGGAIGANPIGGTFSINQVMACPAVNPGIPQVNNISCNGSNDGSIFLNPTGGDNVFSYTWDDPSIGNTNNPTGLSAGTYRVTISSCGGQVVLNNLLPMTITEPAAIIVNTQVQDANCEPNGIIDVQVSGGLQPFTYTWSDPTLRPLNRPTNVSAGTYNLTVRDANGCATVVNGIVVGQSATSTLAVTTDIVHATCSGRADGQVNLSVNGSISGLVCNWGGTNGIFGCSPMNVPAGTYTVNVSAAGGCDTPVPVVVGNQIVVSASATATPDVCASNDGEIEIRPSGGTEPYFYSWRGPVSIPNTAMATNIPSGDYMVTVTDDNSCTVAIDNIVVSGVDAPVTITPIAQNNSECEDDPTGSIAVDVTGGTMPYTYEWETAEGEPVPGGDGPVIDDLSAGVYSLTTTDVNGCTRQQSYTIAENSTLDATIETTGVFPNIVATATVVGNNPPFTFIWCNGDSTMTTTSTLSVGTCNLMIIDNLGCSIIRTVEVDSRILEVNIIESSSISCAGDSDGILQAEPNGGGIAPYTYQWSNGATSQVIVNLGPGNYDVTITDAVDNTSTQSFNLQAPTPIDIATVSNISACEDNGSIEIGISGGTAPYSIAWSTGAINTTNIDSLRADEYGVIVTDARDCTASAMITNNVDETCVACYTGLEVITPNEDGRNDAFRLNCAAQAKGNVLRIFNRWGELVYEVEGYSCTIGTEDDCWRGQNLSNRDLPKGGYFWVFEFEDGDGQVERIRDHITILRE